MVRTLGEERGELRERPPKKELDDRACECMVLGFAMAMMALRFPFLQSFTNSSPLVAKGEERR